MSCDDFCDFKISLSDPMNPDALEQILKRDSYTHYRDFYKQDNKYNTDDDPQNDNIGFIFSVWVPLVGG